MNVIAVKAKKCAAPYRQLLEQHGSPLLVLDCDVVRRQYRCFKSALPGVGVYFAIKSLPERAVLATLAGEGAGFDVATSGELELLRGIGANPAHAIHTHPIKREQDILDALEFGCDTFVVDNIDELQKFERFGDQAELLLRVSFRARGAACDLSRKFGCDVRDVPFLLNEAARLGIVIKGLSFHVGSQSPDSAAHVEAIRACKAYFNGPTLLGAADLRILDIGGGFPTDYARQGADFDAFCAPIREALAELPVHVQVIAEPGRFLSAPCITSINTVIGRAARAGVNWYYLDDGVYGAYSGQIYDHAHYPLTVFADGAGACPAVLAGPTCDSIDVICEGIDLPRLSIGDIVVGELMGAYTLASASEFNSIPKPKLLAVNTVEATGASVSPLFAEAVTL